MKIALLQGLLLGLLASGLFITAVCMYTNKPDVIFSYSTGKCVEVINVDGSKGDCNKLPEKYNHYWSK